MVKPRGVSPFFPNTRALGTAAKEMSWYLLDQAKIAMVPGTVLGNFGADYVRISNANSYENLKKAMDRMRAALQKITS